MAPPRKDVVKGYRMAGKQRAHRVRAENALGKPLPAGAHVHHADGTTGDNAPLVICQDAAYHALLHVRMRVLRAGGDPNSQRVCGVCRGLFPIGSLTVNRCTDCHRAAANQWHRAKKAARNAEVSLGL